MIKPIDYLVLTLLGAVWGASFLFIGVAVPEFGPLNLMLLRVLIAGVIMFGVARLTIARGDLRRTLNLRHNWRNYLIIGLFNSALPFTLIAWSELRLPVSLASILNSTTPLFTAVVAAVVGMEVMRGRKIAGVLLGVAGVTVLMWGADVALDRGMVTAALASLLAAFCYGVGAVFAARHFSRLPAPLATSVQMLTAAMWLAAPGVMTTPAVRPSAVAIAATTALILLSTTFAYVLYFHLLQRIGPTRTSSVTFLVPVFGSAWGILLLGEPFSWGMVVGMGIILLSVGLVIGRAEATEPQREIDAFSDGPVNDGAIINGAAGDD